MDFSSAPTRPDLCFLHFPNIQATFLVVLTGETPTCSQKLLENLAQEGGRLQKRLWLPVVNKVPLWETGFCGCKVIGCSVGTGLATAHEQVIPTLTYGT